MSLRDALEAEGTKGPADGKTTEQRRQRAAGNAVAEGTRETPVRVQAIPLVDILLSLAGEAGRHMGKIAYFPCRAGGRNT